MMLGVGTGIANASPRGTAMDLAGGVSGTAGHVARVLSLDSAARVSFTAEL